MKSRVGEGRGDGTGPVRWRWRWRGCVYVGEAWSGFVEFIVVYDGELHYHILLRVYGIMTSTTMVKHMYQEDKMAGANPNRKWNNIVSSCDSLSSGLSHHPMSVVFIPLSSIGS